MEYEEITFGGRCSLCCKFHWRGWVLFLGPLILLPFLFMKPILEYRALYTVFLMALYWFTEAMPIAVTAMIPIFTFPLMGILSSSNVCMLYMNNTVIVFMAALMIGLGIEYSNLHKRLAKCFIVVVGSSPRRLHLVLVFFTMFVSMWLNNATTTAIMCPIVKAILEDLQEVGMVTLTTDEVPTNEDDPPFPSKTAICYYLGVAYASTIGGIGSLIGSDTNLLLVDLHVKRFPDQGVAQFGSWMLFCVPPMLLYTGLMYVSMQFKYMGLCRPNSVEGQEMLLAKERASVAKQAIRQKQTDMESISCHELQVGVLFLILFLLNFTINPKWFDGWVELVNEKEVNTSVPFMIIIFCLFTLPVNFFFMKYCICQKPKTEQSLPSLVTWKHIGLRLPWSSVILLGGSFALADGIAKSGLAKMCGNGLESLVDGKIALFAQFICILIGICASTISANMPMCAIMIPVIQDVATKVNMRPMFLTVPTTVALSMAFLLPVSTPSNAVAASYANIRTRSMLAAGIAPTLIAIILLPIFSATWLVIVMPAVTETIFVT